MHDVKPYKVCASKRCIFVACGPTGPLAQKAATRGWGDLVTLNRGLQFFDRVKLAFFGTAGKINDTRGHWHKAGHLAVLFDDNDPHAYYQEELPRRRLLRLKTLTITREPKGLSQARADREAAMRDHIHDGNIIGRASAALYHLQRLGYRTVWLFGHDGGHARAPCLDLESTRRGYVKSRFCTEEMLRYLGLAYAFYPDKAPG